MSAERRPHQGRMSLAQWSNAHEPSARLSELLEIWRNALLGVWQRKLLWLALIFFAPCWLTAIYHWAAMPLARPWQLILVAATALILIAVPAAALWFNFRHIAWAVVLTAPGYTTVVLGALCGLWLPWQIIWWVIPFGSAALEGSLAAARLALADILFSAVLVWLGVVLSRADAPQHEADN